MGASRRDCAAAIYSLLGTAKLNRINQEAYLRQVLEQIADPPDQSHRRSAGPIAHSCSTYDLPSLDAYKTQTIRIT